MSLIPFLERGIWCVLDLNILELSLFGEIQTDSNRIKRFHPKEECIVFTNFRNLVNFDELCLTCCEAYLDFLCVRRQ